MGAEEAFCRSLMAAWTLYPKEKAFPDVKLASAHFLYIFRNREDFFSYTDICIPMEKKEKCNNMSPFLTLCVTAQTCKRRRKGIFSSQGMKILSVVVRRKKGSFFSLSQIRSLFPPRSPLARPKRKFPNLYQEPRGEEKLFYSALRICHRGREKKKKRSACPPVHRR